MRSSLHRNELRTRYRHERSPANLKDTASRAARRQTHGGHGNDDTTNAHPLTCRLGERRAGWAPTFPSATVGRDPRGGGPMTTQEVNRGEMRGSASGGLSALWIAALLVGVLVLSAVAIVKAGALHTLTAKALLSVTIPLFFGVSFAAMRMDTRSGREVPPYAPPVEDDLVQDDDAQPVAELDQVYSWRSARLGRLGVERGIRRVLAAEPSFNIHELERLLAAGCPLVTALRILEPD
jgi:hypothetical protein